MSEILPCLWILVCASLLHASETGFGFQATFIFMCKCVYIWFVLIAIHTHACTLRFICIDVHINRQKHLLWDIQIHLHGHKQIKKQLRLLVWTIFRWFHFVLPSGYLLFFLDEQKCHFKNNTLWCLRSNLALPMFLYLHSSFVFFSMTL